MLTYQINIWNLLDACSWRIQKALRIELKDELAGDMTVADRILGKLGEGVPPTHVRPCRSTSHFNLGPSSRLTNLGLDVSPIPARCEVLKGMDGVMLINYGKLPSLQCLSRRSSWRYQS